MNEALIELIKKAYVEILSILLALLGYFINSTYNKIRDDQTETSKKLDLLSSKVSALENSIYKEILLVSEDKIGHCQQNMDDRIKSIWRALDDVKASTDYVLDSVKKDLREVEKRLQLIENSMAAIKTRINMNKREGD